MSFLLLAALACMPKVPEVAPAPAYVPAPTPAPTPAVTPAPAPDTVAVPSVDVPTAWDPAATASTPSAPAPQTGPDRTISDAAAMLTTQDVGRARAALDMLKPLTGQYPDRVEIPYNIGLAHHILGDDTEARRSWLRATEVEPGFAKPWLNLGALSARRGQMEAALSSFQAGIRQAPTDVSLRVAAIDAHRTLKRYKDAEAEAKAALLIDSRAIEIYNALTAVYLESDQLDLARFMSLKAGEVVAGAERNAELQANLGQIHLRGGYPGSAIESFKKALDLDPNQVSALAFLSGYYLDNRNYRDAIPLLERMMGLFPERAGPRINVAIAYRGEKRYEDAIRLYNDALRLEPSNPDPHRNLAVLYGDYMKSWDTAIEEIEVYRRAGGGPATELDQWIAQLIKDKEKALKRARKDEDERKRREAEEAAKQAPPPIPEPAPLPVPEPLPEPEPASAPTPEPAPAPWGTPVEPVPQPAPEAPPPAGGSEPSPWGG